GDQGKVHPVILVIKAPFLNWTVDKLKTHISHVYPSKPSSKDQRLVYSGKLLLDHLTLKYVLRKVCLLHSFSYISSSPDILSRDYGSVCIHLRFTFLNYMWNQFQPQQGPPTNMPAYPGIQYNPMTLLWWQQVNARQYYIQMLAASSHYLRPDLLSAQPGQSDPLNLPPLEERHGDPNIQLNAQGNCDWLDWVYTVSCTAILLSIVYFYSSFSRFVMVIGAMLLLYLHQAERVMDDGLGDDDADSGEEGPEDPNGITHVGFLSTTWSFIVTFFMSLIPEGPPNAAN
uniref:Homocysteine-responsive endoplasmic reticulum-resident ubiquitin-like domain member 2 protein n=1 Tax=Oncorhynchus kisutch TaxID=8019 RepID=A0A8C7CYV9_ONCKI